MKLVIQTCECRPGIESLLKQFSEFRQALTQIKEQILMTEKDLTNAVTKASADVTANIAAALTKEKQELIDAFKAVPPAGVSDEAAKLIVDMIGGIGSSTVPGVDDLSKAVGGTPAPPNPTEP